MPVLPAAGGPPLRVALLLAGLLALAACSPDPGYSQEPAGTGGAAAVAAGEPARPAEPARANTGAAGGPVDDLLASLCAELGDPAESSWTIAAGCPRVPALPAALVGAGAWLFLATEERLERYDAGTGAWAAEPVALPAPVGPGVALCTRGPDEVIVVRGAESGDVWSVAFPEAAVRALPVSPRPVGEGGAVASAGGRLYLAPGGELDEFWMLEPEAGSWRELGRIGGESSLKTGFGRTTGLLATLGTGLYAWPNHHIHRFDLEAGEWKDGNWLAMGFMPSLDGGGAAADEELGSIFAVGGMYSRSLQAVVPSEHAAYFLWPRLPYPIVGGGSRVAVARAGGVPHLFVYAVEPDNALCHIPAAELRRVTRDDDVADEDTAWRRLHVHGGGNGVRHWSTRSWREPPGPMDDTLRAAGTLGLMGALDGQLFAIRRAFTRRIDPATGLSTHYPGINLGKYVALGAAAVYDGERHLYVCTGRSDYFLRWDVPRTPPEKVRRGPRPPLDHTDLEVLPPMPAAVGLSLIHI